MLPKSMLLTLLAFSALAAEPTVPAGIQIHRNIDFASIPHGKLAMDIARPASPGPHPAVVLIHGGGFSGGKRDSYLPMAIRLAQHGYVAATVSYRLTPLVQFPLPLHDIKSAVRFLRANSSTYAIDKLHIGAIGVSAGATFSQFLAIARDVPSLEGNGPHKQESSSVDCAVSYYGRSDLYRAYEGSRNAATALPPLLGGDREHSLDAHFRASPLNWITPNSAPILAIHGTRDQNVPFSQSVWLVERMRSMGIEAELETIAEAGHGFKGPDEERAFDRTLHFLNRHLKPRSNDTRTLLINDHGPGAELLAVSWPSGRILWRRPNHRGTELSITPSGTILYIEDPKGIVTEIDSAQRTLWQFKTSNVNLVSAQRLPNGNTLLTDDAHSRVLEVNPKGDTVWSAAFPQFAGKAMRRARRTASGTTLVAVQVAGLLLELDAKGNIIRQLQFPNRMPAYAKPLPDGGMLIGLAAPGEVRRIDASGNVTATFAGPNSNTRMAWTSGFTETPSGGLIVSDYMGARIVEFDASGKLLHQLKNFPWAVTSIALLP